jgi:hypothetical protein
MGTLDIQGFAAAADAVALKLDGARLPGLLRRALVVPARCVAFVRDGDGSEAVLRAGAEQAPPFTGVLVKEGDVAVPIQLAGLATKEGHAATAGVELVLAASPRAIELKELLGTLLADRERVDTADLRAYLLPPVRAALALFVGGHTAEEIATLDLRAGVEARVREELKPAIFSAGLDLRDVRHPSFFCEAFEGRRKAEAEAREQEDELRRGERLQELRAQLEKNEVLKKKEVDELAKVLQYEGVLKELSLKNELDKKRKHDEIQKFEALYQRLGNDDAKALVFMLEDERLKADLIKSIAERGMTEEQIRARRSSEVERKLEARLDELQKKLGELSGQRATRIAENGTRTRRVLGCYAKTVVSYDPASHRREAPKEVYDLERGGLGFVRSARVVVTRDGYTVLAGAQRGVYVVREADPKVPRELKFPREPQGQGGVNAAAYFDGHVYATHSELGLFRWDMYLGAPEQLYSVITGRHDSTRGALVTADGKLFFASGPDVFRADLVKPDADVLAFRGGEDSITAFAATRDEVLAGTKGGRVLRWSLSDPGSPRELSVRKAEPIYMLKVAELAGEDHVLIGAKDHGVTAISLGDGRSFDFRARDQIRWVDGASDFVFGVSRGGYSIHVWEAGRLDGEAFEVRTPDRLQDLFVHKERAQAAAT